jgi:hypothetical protein
VAQQVRRKATREQLDELADLVDGQTIAHYVAELRRARDEKRSGSVSLEDELSFGTNSDAWVNSRLPPRRSAA